MPYLSRILAFVALGLLVACAPAAPSPTAAPPKPAAKPAASPAAEPAPKPAASPAAKVAAKPALKPLAKAVEFKFRTPFAPSTGYAPFYAASDLYWPELGLRVEVLPGTGSAAGVKTVGAGSEQMGYSALSSVIAGIQEGVPITALAVFARRDSSGIIYLEKSGVKDWKDLPGKTVGNFPGGSTGPIVKATLKAKGVDPESVRFVNVNPGGEMALLMAGQIEIHAGFARSQDIWLRCKGVQAGSLSAYDAGLEQYGQVVFANNDWLKQVGDEVVTRALFGAIKGATLLKSDPEKALGVMYKLQPNVQTDRVQELAGLHSEGYTNWQFEGGPILREKGFGWMDKGEMEKSQEVLVSAGLLQEKGDVSKYYTTKYLEDESVRAAAMEWVNTPWAQIPADVRQQCGLK